MKNETVSRRGFIGAIGAATAAAALPSAALATISTWPNAASTLAFHRAEYLAEVERFALALRPRFAAGELRAFASGDDERFPGDRWLREHPMHVLEGLCGEHFGCRATRVAFAYYTGPVGPSLMLLAVSPHGEATEGDWCHVSQWAQEAAAWDVLTVARKRGFYTMAPGEERVPNGEEVAA